ncbi:MAG: hypothetical protein NUV78_01110 [Candidatus Zambryskibacteria bacterium]|nr:hypothetical protein [Candidatus Zambryskibacteria bacterium]
MKLNKFIVFPVAAVLALGTFGSASAQTASPRLALQFGTNGLTNPLVANTTNATVARLLLDTTGSSEAIRLSSLPFNLIVGNGASASTLTNCRAYNEAAPNTALNSSATTAMVSGINNITFDSAMILSANTLTTVALRCDVSADLVAGGTFTVNMNTNNVVATGASTGLPALVTIRGSVIVPPVVVPPVTPGMPVTGGEATQNIAMLAASLLIAGLAFTSISARKTS